jgi:hypothetical protein
MRTRFRNIVIPNKPEESFSMTPWTLSITASLLLLAGGTAVRPAQVPLLGRPEVTRIGLHTVLAPQGAAYSTYSNARYGFSISYPGSLLVPQGESDNGDGQKFVSRDGSASLAAFGSNRLDRSLQEEFRSAQENRNVTYKVLRRDMFVVSGTEDGKIFYQKTLLRGDVFKTFIIEYDERKRGVYDAVTTRVARSFVG